MLPSTKNQSPLIINFPCFYIYEKIVPSAEQLLISMNSTLKSNPCNNVVLVVLSTSHNKG